MHTSLACAACDARFAIDQLNNLCTVCSKPLLAGYDLDSLRGRFTPEIVRRRTLRSMWKFWDVLPVDAPEQAVSLGEGRCGFVPVRRLHGQRLRST